MKRNLLLSLLLVLLNSMSLAAYDFEVDGIYYKINQDSVSVSVTYKKNYSTDNTYSGEVVVPPKVSYNGMTYLVNAIDKYAFYKCSGLKWVVLPITLKTINSSAFSDCSSLSHINIPDSVTYIGYSAFDNCKSLTELFIPVSVQKIDPYAFDECCGVSSIVVDEDNLYYDSRENCNAIIEKARNELKVACINTVIPNSVKRLGQRAFYGLSSISEIDLPDSLEYIGSEVFRGCSGLTSIDIPNTVTTIEGLAFSGTGLTSLHIPANVAQVGTYLLSGSNNVTSITVDQANPNYDSRNNCNAIIETATNTLINSPLKN